MNILLGVMGFIYANSAPIPDTEYGLMNCEKTWVQVWSFEDNLYMELEGHIYCMHYPKHSEKCYCNLAQELP